MAATAIPRIAMAATTSEEPLKQPPEKSRGLKRGCGILHNSNGVEAIEKTALKQNPICAAPV
jgi:hypothetical protein